VAILSGVAVEDWLGENSPHANIPKIAGIRKRYNFLFCIFFPSVELYPVLITQKRDTLPEKIKFSSR
jgi:hypothetical protein